MSNTINVDTPEAVRLISDALATELVDQAEQLIADLKADRGGSSVALTDARDACRRITYLTDALEQLDPPGWKAAYTLSAVSEAVA